MLSTVRRFVRALDGSEGQTQTRGRKRENTSLAIRPRCLPAHNSSPSSPPLPLPHPEARKGQCVCRRTLSSGLLASDLEKLISSTAAVTEARPRPAASAAWRLACGR